MTKATDAMLKAVSNMDNTKKRTVSTMCYCGPDQPFCDPCEEARAKWKRENPPKK